MAVLTSNEQRQLLDLARRALTARVRKEPPPEPGRGGALDAPLGAFVTIHLAGALRGCLGRLDPRASLAATIAHLGAAVADSDPRFPPVRDAELLAIAVEISVLTPDRPIASVDEIEVGRHGLVVEEGRRRGLLLPQVAVEHGWTAVELVEHTCEKAGLPRDAWRHGAKLAVFEAEILRDG